MVQSDERFAQGLTHARHNMHAYEHKPDVIYTDLARLRWPSYEITGSGSIAVVMACARKVHLCSWPLQAQHLRSEKCCDNCNHAIAPEHRWHIIQILNEPQPPAPIQIRNRALLERD